METRSLWIPVTFKPQLRGCELFNIMQLTEVAVRAGSDYTTCLTVQWGETGQDGKKIARMR